MANEDHFRDDTKMIRLIDANELRKEFEWLESVVNGCSKAEVRDTIQRIDNAPTVDAVEVVHGEWRLVGVDAGKKTAVAECSVCDAVFEVPLSSLALNYNHCPTCGADMR